MKAFSATIQLPAVPDALQQAFTDMANASSTGMAAVARECAKLQEKLDHANRENHSLRAEVQRLKAELGRYQPGCGSVESTGKPREPAPMEQEQFVLERSIAIHDAPVHSVSMANAISELGQVVATASWDATVKLYDLAKSEIVSTLGDVKQSEEGKMGGLYAVAFSKTAPDILGCTSCDKSVYLWNHRTGQLQTKLNGHQDEVNGMDFHGGQPVMCTASDDCKVMIWDFQEGMVLRTLDKHSKAVYGCTFLGLENQYLVATCCFDSKVRVFDMRDKKAVSTLNLHTDDIIGIDYSSSNTYLASGSDDGLIGIWDTRTWEVLHRINTKADINDTDNEVKRVSFSPDGGLLAAACSSGRVLVYDVNKAPPKQVTQLGGHSDCVFDVTWGVDPRTGLRTLVSASHDNTCQAWKEVAL